MKIGFNADTHLYGPHAMELVEHDRFPIHLVGDIVDLDLCKYSDLDEARAKIEQLRKKYGERFNSGNHSLMFFNLHTILETPKGRYYITHGDREQWGETGSTLYRNLFPGEGWFVRWFVKWTSGMKDFFRPKPNKKCIARAVKKMKEHNCTGYIAGHWHTKKVLEIVVHDEHRINKLRFLPRGYSELDL